MDTIFIGTEIADIRTRILRARIPVITLNEIRTMRFVTSRGQRILQHFFTCAARGITNVFFAHRLFPGKRGTCFFCKLTYSIVTAFPTLTFISGTACACAIRTFRHFIEACSGLRIPRTIGLVAHSALPRRTCRVHRYWCCDTHPDLTCAGCPVCLLVAGVALVPPRHIARLSVLLLPIDAFFYIVVALLINTRLRIIPIGLDPQL